ncbi:hypothetical protein MMC29_006225 [Sticta canariensis]|nr:hypothetical protein [Sticta canariensis]
MFDPTTITAAISVSLSVLSLISSTISTLMRQKDEIVQCRTRLNAYIYQLQDQRRHLTRWRYLWYVEHGLAHGLYIHCWGAQGYSEIQRRLMDIQDLIKSIEVHLKLSKQLSSTEYRQWNEVVKNLSAPEPGLLERVAFALVKNTKLKEELDRLKTLVEGLDIYSRGLLREQQNSDPEKNVTREELKTLANAFTLQKGLSKFATDLFTFHSDSNQVHEWDLELRLPDEDGDAAMHEITDIASLSIDFLLQCKCLGEIDMARRFRVEYRTKYHSQDNDPPWMAGAYMIDQIRSCSSGPHFHGNFEFDEPCRSLEHPHAQDRSLKMIFGEGKAPGTKRRVFDHDRISIALALVNWVILLYNTPWTSAPCTCKIRRIQLQNSEERYVFVSRLDTHSGPPCFGEDLSDRKLVSLGIALAELALATSLTVSKGNEEVIFFKNDKKISRAEILQDLKRSNGRLGITEAVQYCLNTSEMPGDIRAERLLEYAENILEPSVSCTSKLLLQLTLVSAFEINSPAQKNVIAASSGEEGSSLRKNDSEMRIQTIPSGNTHSLTIMHTLLPSFEELAS